MEQIAQFALAGSLGFLAGILACGMIIYRLLRYLHEYSEECERLEKELFMWQSKD